MSDVFVTKSSVDNLDSLSNDAESNQATSYLESYQIYEPDSPSSEGSSCDALRANSTRQQIGFGARLETPGERMKALFCLWIFFVVLAMLTVSVSHVKAVSLVDAAPQNDVNLADILRETQTLRAQVKKDQENLRKVHDALDIARAEAEELRRRLDQESKPSEEEIRMEAGIDGGWFAWFGSWRRTTTKAEIKIEGCHDIPCCVSLFLELSRALVLNSWELFKLLFVDPLGFGRSVVEDGWDNSITLGLVFLNFWLRFVFVNFLALVVLKIAKVKDGLMWFWQKTCELPVVQLVIKMVALVSLGVFCDSKQMGLHPDLKKIREELGRLKTEMRRSEEGEQLRSLRRELEELKKCLSIRGKEDVSTPRTRSPSPRLFQKTSGASPSLCKQCGKVHGGECWSKPCAACGRTGACEHRWKTTWAYRRQQQLKAISMEDEGTSQARESAEYREARLASLENQVNELLDDGSVSLNGKSPAFEFDVKTASRNSRLLRSVAVINGHQCEDCLVDTGAEGNVVFESEARRLGLKFLSDGKEIVIRAFDEAPVRALGMAVAKMKWGPAGEEMDMDFIVCPGEGQVILGLPAIRKFKIDIIRGTNLIHNESGEVLRCASVSFHEVVSQKNE